MVIFLIFIFRIFNNSNYFLNIIFAILIKKQTYVSLFLLKLIIKIIGNPAPGAVIGLSPGTSVYLGVGGSGSDGRVTSCYFGVPGTGSGAATKPFGGASQSPKGGAATSVYFAAPGGAGAASGTTSTYFVPK